MISSCMRQKTPELSGEVLPTKPSFETWAPSAPYSCRLDSEDLPEPGDYHTQMEYAGKAADIIYSDMISRGISENDAMWVYSHVLARFNARVQDNNESFMSRSTASDSPSYTQELLTSANKGEADVHRLMRIREYFDLKSIELGRVSAPYLNARELYVNDMLSSVQKEIEHRSGVFEPGEPELKIDWEYREDKNSNEKLAQRGILTISTKLGFLEDGTIFAKRESFAVVLPNEIAASRLYSPQEIMISDPPRVEIIEPLAVTAYCYSKFSEERSKKRQADRQQ